MFSLVSLLATAALVSLCGQAYGAILNRGSAEMDNELKPNVPLSHKRNSVVKHYIRIIPMPKIVAVDRGETLVLECQIYASPNPSATWLKNGEPIMYEEESNEIITPHPFSLAHLTAKLVLRAPHDGDIYTCMGTAGEFDATDSTTVLVKGQEKDEDLQTLENLLTPSKPVITSSFSEVIQPIGTNIVLPCRVHHGDAKTQVFWSDNDDQVVYGNSRFRPLPSGDLLITALRWSDMGVFTCVAKNMYGKDTAATFLYPVKA